MICVMKGGKIIEKGNHEELIALKGLYSDMVMAQERHKVVQKG
jgi:ABC-type multidrug transport system fused ATPase/permease subunit